MVDLISTNENIHTIQYYYSFYESILKSTLGISEIYLKRRYLI
jgi:hypothetical protein